VDLLILITLGTQANSFERLLQEVQNLIHEGYITEKVIVQAGTTKFHSDCMEIFDFIPIEKFNDLIKSCNLLITHGGVGSIISGLNNKKKVIAVPRYKKYGEHVNDHQLEIVENFNDKQFILGIRELSELKDAIEKSKTFQPKQYHSNRQNMIALVESYIDKM